MGWLIFHQWGDTENSKPHKLYALSTFDLTHRVELPQLFDQIEPCIHLDQEGNTFYLINGQQWNQLDLNFKLINSGEVHENFDAMGFPRDIKVKFPVFTISNDYYSFSYNVLTNKKETKEINHNITSTDDFTFDRQTGLLTTKEGSVTLENYSKFAQFYTDEDELYSEDVGAVHLEGGKFYIGIDCDYRETGERSTKWISFDLKTGKKLEQNEIFEIFGDNTYSSNWVTRKGITSLLLGTHCDDDENHRITEYYYSLESPRFKTKSVKISPDMVETRSHTASILSDDTAFVMRGDGARAILMHFETKYVQEVNLGEKISFLGYIRTPHNSHLLNQLLSKNLYKDLTNIVLSYVE